MKMTICYVDTVLKHFNPEVFLRPVLCAHTLLIAGSVKFQGWHLNMQFHKSAVPSGEQLLFTSHCKSVAHYPNKRRSPCLD